MRNNLMKLNQISLVLRPKRLIIFGQNSSKNATVAIMGAIGDANLMTKHGLAGEICVF